MRPGWIMSALIATACAGGQTGEITDLTACAAPVGTVAVDQPSDAGRSAREQLAELMTRAEAALAWQDGGSSTLAISFDLSGEPATLLGGPECARPWLEAPVTITLRTEDGAIDDTVEGTVLLTDMGSASVQASITIADMNGALAEDHPDLDPQLTTLRIDLLSDGDSIGGQLTLSEDASDAPLASF